MRLLMLAAVATLAACATTPAATTASAPCDAACLEAIADQYRAAYLAHDPSLAPFADAVRYSENQVEMPFPDGTWDTVTEETGPALTLSDPSTGQAAIFTAIFQRAIPGFLAVRLKVENGEITEVEHVISTARNLSSPPTPIGDARAYVHNPVIDVIEPEAERAPRERLIEHGHGYFNTLHNNTGEIRGTAFAPDSNRRENGLLFEDIEAAFKLGRYRFNDRVRREVILVDEARQVSLFRGFIDHKGVLDTYTLTDGTPATSVFQEPQTWGFLEMFKIKDDQIAAVVATFTQSPYYTVSPWTEE